MGTKNNPGSFDCHEAAEPDEPRFTLLGRDPQAGARVRDWANARVCNNDRDAAKIAEAFECARAMDDWYDKLVADGKRPKR